MSYRIAYFRLPPVLLLSMMLYGMEWSLWSVGVTCPTFFFSQSTWGQGEARTGQGAAAWGTEKALVLYKHCSAIAKTLVCYQHLVTARRTGSCEENCLHPSQTQYSWNYRSQMGLYIDQWNWNITFWFHSYVCHFSPAWLDCLCTSLVLTFMWFISSKLWL